MVFSAVNFPEILISDKS